MYNPLSLKYQQPHGTLIMNVKSNAIKCEKDIQSLVHTW